MQPFRQTQVWKYKLCGLEYKRGIHSVDKVINEMNGILKAIIETCLLSVESIKNK
jgi:deoxyribose-phosphate aldolase